MWKPVKLQATQNMLELDAKSTSTPNLEQYCSKMSKYLSSILSFATKPSETELEETYVLRRALPRDLIEMTDVLLQKSTYC